MESIWKGSKVLQCELVSKGHLVCDDGEKWVVDEYGSLSAAEETTYALICVGLVLFAGLMSGLTLGLLSLDPIHLEIWRNSSDARRKESALKVIPLLKSRHHVLVTLLVCNAAAMEALPIFLDRIVSAPWIAIVISVSAVLMFGEIIPQAVCSRYGLIIGAKSVLIVKFLMLLTGIFTWPIGKLLDLILGKEDHFFEREELKELVTIHTGPANLSVDEVTIIRGALDMKSKTVSDAMTPIDKVFMLEANVRLSKAVMQEITKKGHSRIPVYSQKKNKILGQLLVKTLINVDPDANTRVADVPLRDLPSVSHNVPLYDVLNEFQTGKSHMALVCNEQYHVIGIITLEDIIEELIQEEIADETDQPTTPGLWRKSLLDKIKVTVEPSGGGQASQEYTPLIRHYGSTNQ